MQQRPKEQFLCLFVYFKRLHAITFALICHRIVIVAMSYYNPLIKIVKCTSLSHFPKTTHRLKYDHPCELLQVNSSLQEKTWHHFEVRFTLFPYDILLWTVGGLFIYGSQVEEEIWDLGNNGNKDGCEPRQFVLPWHSLSGFLKNIFFKDKLKYA